MALTPEIVDRPTLWVPATREKRDPSAATQPLTYTSPGRPMVPTWDADTAIRWAYYANVIVYRCTQILANTIAALPFVAGRRAPRIPGEIVDTDDGARLSQLLGPPPGGPAPKLTARRLWAWTVAQRVVTGRHGWEIERNGNQVAALWPLVASNLKAIPSTGGSEWFARFEYGRVDRPRVLQPDQILYGWDPAADDFRQPESRLQAARLDISIAVMMDRYNYGFLRNDARPAAVVVTEAFDNDDEYRAFKQRWQGEFGGPENAGKAVFIETSPDGAPPSAAIDVKMLGLNQKDARFIEQHKASLERIAIAIGVPWSKLDASGRTFDNASEEDHNWWESTILPLVTDLADEVNMQLAPMLGRQVGWFDLSGVRALQAPKQVQAVGVPALMQSMLATFNEGRALVGLDPIPGGDRFPTPGELAMLQGRDPVAELPAEPVSAPPPAPELPAANAEPERSPTVETRAFDAEMMEVRRTRIWRNTDATVRTLEARWERAWRRLFERQRKATLSRLEGNRGHKVTGQRAPADEVFDPQFWMAETAEETTALYELVTTAGFARVSDLFGISFDLEAEFAQDFVRARANQLAGSVTATTYDAIQAALAAGVAEGEAIPDIAERVRHVFEVASDSRATTIARTEVISAFNGSATLSASTLPADVVGGREWIATRDGRTRPDHGEADGQVVAIDAAFAVGGESMLYPGDPAGGADQTVNCRCTVAFLTPDEMLERSKVAERRAPVDRLAASLHLLADREFDLLAARRAFMEVAA